MRRAYTMRKRADAREQVRDRIMRATMQLHDEQGVAATTFADVATRAGVGQATVYRHFPTIGDLVNACGMHVWQEMQPPMPHMAAGVFADIVEPRARLARLIAEIDAFYGRGSLRLTLAGHDRAKLPQLDGFLSAVEAGLEALVREALAPAEMSVRREISAKTVRVAMTLLGLPVWTELRRLGLPDAERAALTLRLLECGICAASDG